MPLLFPETLGMGLARGAATAAPAQAPPEPGDPDNHGTTAEQAGLERLEGEHSPWIERRGQHHQQHEPRALGSAPRPFSESADPKTRPPALRTSKALPRRAARDPRTFHAEEQSTPRN